MTARKSEITALRLAEQLGQSNTHLNFAAAQLRLTRTALRDIVGVVKELKFRDTKMLRQTTKWQQHMPYAIALANAEQLLRPADSDLMERMKQLDVTPLTT